MVQHKNMQTPPLVGGGGNCGVGAKDVPMVPKPRGHQPAKSLQEVNRLQKWSECWGKTLRGEESLAHRPDPPVLSPLRALQKRTPKEQDYLKAHKPETYLMGTGCGDGNSQRTGRTGAADAVGHMYPGHRQGVEPPTGANEGKKDRLMLPQQNRTHGDTSEVGSQRSGVDNGEERPPASRDRTPFRETRREENTPRANRAPQTASPTRAPSIQQTRSPESNLESPKSWGPPRGSAKRRSGPNPEDPSDGRQSESKAHTEDNSRAGTDPPRPVYVGTDVGPDPCCAAELHMTAQGEIEAPDEALRRHENDVTYYWGSNKHAKAKGDFLVAYIPYPLILGTDCLHQLKALWDLAKGKLRLSAFQPPIDVSLIERTTQGSKKGVHALTKGEEEEDKQLAEEAKQQMVRDIKDLSSPAAAALGVSRVRKQFTALWERSWRLKGRSSRS
ncbi:hypothetical protein Emag_003559 [Eimeria magna]